MSEIWEYLDVQEQQDDRFPWPPPEGAPIVATLGQTWRSATFDPSAFFRQVPRDGGTGPALVYYMVVGMLVAGATLFWRALSYYSGRMETETLASELGLQALDPVVGFLLSPAFLLLTLAISAGVVHLLLLVFGGATHGFGTTIRVSCYAYSPMLFAFVPILGPLIGGVWMLVLLVVGLREAHETEGWKPFLAVLLPFILVLVLFLLFLVMVLAAASTLVGG
jgi:hypothetical protein